MSTSFVVDGMPRRAAVLAGLVGAGLSFGARIGVEGGSAGVEDEEEVAGLVSVVPAWLWASIVVCS